jgi:hypothetical protein
MCRPDCVELGFVPSRWHDAEGPDENASRHTGCPVTQGWTLVEAQTSLINKVLDYYTLMVRLDACLVLQNEVFVAHTMEMYQV